MKTKDTACCIRVRVAISTLAGLAGFLLLAPTTHAYDALTRSTELQCATTVLARVPGAFAPGYAWDPVAHVYRDAAVGDSLVPGLGYWFFAIQPTVLNPER